MTWIKSGAKDKIDFLINQPRKVLSNTLSKTKTGKERNLKTGCTFNDPPAFKISRDEILIAG
jgi:hypothetical protein